MSQENELVMAGGGGVGPNPLTHTSSLPTATAVPKSRPTCLKSPPDWDEPMSRPALVVVSPSISAALAASGGGETVPLTAERPATAGCWSKNALPNSPSARGLLVV